MVRISSSVEYGMRLMVRLARSGGRAPTSAEVLSVSENIPKDYVDQILRRLRQAGLISSSRGPAGGYALSRATKEIRVGDVARALEHAVFETVCERYSEKDHDCRHQGMCGVRPLWRRLGTIVEGFLDGITLDQILKEEEAVVENLFKSPGAGKAQRG